MIDPAVNKILLGYHRSGVTIPVRNYIGGRRLVGAIARLGASTCEVSSLTTVVAPSISRVLHWPLDSLLSLHVLASWTNDLSDVGALYERVLWSLKALHGLLESMLELSSGLLLRCTLDRFDRWYAYPGSGVVVTPSLAVLLPLTVHDTTAVL
jgi:hypothetical protein